MALLFAHPWIPRPAGSRSSRDWGSKSPYGGQYQKIVKGLPGCRRPRWKDYLNTSFFAPPATATVQLSEARQLKTSMVKKHQYHAPIEGFYWLTNAS
jgi:hypothetical protein